MKEAEEDTTNNWKDVSCSWTRRINSIKMSILLKATYRFNVIPIKIPMTFLQKRKKLLLLFTNIKVILKFVWNKKQ
jgi:hypothetical protein